MRALWFTWRTRLLTFRLRTLTELKRAWDDPSGVYTNYE